MSGGRGGHRASIEPPSETAKDERIRALEEALLNARNSLQSIADGRCGCSLAETMGYAANRSYVAWRALHPHQSWCRTEHEGACVPEERPEP